MDSIVQECLSRYYLVFNILTSKACADKLKREIETFGNPPNFDQVIEEPVKTEDAPADAPANTKRVTAKAAQKGSGAKFQWQIMESLGLPKEEIHKFAESGHWLEFFPPRAVVCCPVFVIAKF